MAQVSVLSTGATLLYTNTGATITNITVHNKGGVSIYLGDSAVSSSTGYELATTESTQPTPVPAGGSLYARGASGTNRVDVLVVG